VSPPKASVSSDGLRWRSSIMHSPMLAILNMTPAARGLRPRD
jgi:hypothetical protein